VNQVETRLSKRETHAREGDRMGEVSGDNAEQTKELAVEGGVCE